MTERYTASDFANAKFSEHPDGRIAARLNTEETRPWESVRDFHTDEGMAADGWVPVPTKPEMTESRVKKMVGDWAVDEFAAGFALGFRQAGGRITPDPEPTNTERLDALKEAWAKTLDKRTLAEYLNDHGVTAPNVKGN